VCVVRDTRTLFSRQSEHGLLLVLRPLNHLLLDRASHLHFLLHLLLGLGRARLALALTLRRSLRDRCLYQRWRSRLGQRRVVVVVVVAVAAAKTRAGGTWVAAPGELKVNGDVGSEAEEVRGADGDCGEKGKPSPRWWGLGTSNDIDANGDNGVVTGPAVGVEVVVAAATTEVAVAEEAAVMPVTSAGSEAEGCSCWTTTMGVASFLASISMIRDEGVVEEDEEVDDDEDEDGDEERMKPDGREGPALPALG